MDWSVAWNTKWFNFRIAIDGLQFFNQKKAHTLLFFIVFNVYLWLYLLIFVSIVLFVVDGACTTLGPFFASTRRNRHVQEPHIGSFHRLGRGKCIGLRGLDRKHLNSTVLVENVVGEVRREPAADAAAMEENGCLIGGHGLRCVALQFNFRTAIDELQLF
jgi:hypothetical protein